MYILHTVFITFPKVLTQRICLTIKNFFNLWSFRLFSWPYCLIQEWCGKEKLVPVTLRGQQVDRSERETKKNIRVSMQEGFEHLRCDSTWGPRRFYFILCPRLVTWPKTAFSEFLTERKVYHIPCSIHLPRFPLCAAMELVSITSPVAQYSSTCPDCGH